MTLRQHFQCRRKMARHTCLISASKATNDDFGDISTRKGTVKQIASGNEEKANQMAIKAEMIARGRRIFSPYAYPPIDQPVVTSNTQVRTSIVLTNVVIKDQRGHFAEIIVLADNTTDVSMISHATIEKFNLAPNVKYSTDQSGQITTEHDSIDLTLYFNYTVINCHAQIFQDMNNDVLVLGTQYMSMNDDYHHTM